MLVPQTDSSQQAKKKAEPQTLQYVPLQQAMAAPLSKLNKRSHPLFPVLRGGHAVQGVVQDAGRSHQAGCIDSVPAWWHVQWCASS